MTQLHLLQGTIYSFKCCRLIINEFLSIAEMEQINALVPLMQAMKPINGAELKFKENPTACTNADKLSILITNLAKDTANLLYLALDVVPDAEKLQIVKNKLNST